MASLKDIECVARACHAAAMEWGEPEIPRWEILDDEEQEAIQNQVLDFLTGKDVGDPLFKAICTVLLGITPKPVNVVHTAGYVSHFPPGSDFTVTSAAHPPPFNHEPFVQHDSNEQQGDWVVGPDGKNVWQGKKPERQPRGATQEELNRIQARIAEAEMRR